jgi:hypothetical protein
MSILVLLDILGMGGNLLTSFLKLLFRFAWLK